MYEFIRIGIALEIANMVIDALAKDMGVSRQDYSYILEQRQMDDLGIGING